MPTTPLRSHETEEVRPERRAAEILLEQGDLEGARERLEAYLATEPDDARARGLLGLCCFRLGLLDDAARLYGALVERNPDDATLRVNLGLVALKRGDAAEAAAQFEVAVSLAPTHRKALNYLGLALAQRGELALARDAFERAGATAMAERMAAQLAAAAEAALAEPGPAEAAADRPATEPAAEPSAATPAAPIPAAPIAGESAPAQADFHAGAAAVAPADAESGKVEGVRAETGDARDAGEAGDEFEISAISEATAEAAEEVDFSDAASVSEAGPRAAPAPVVRFGVQPAEPAGPAAVATPRVAPSQPVPDFVGVETLRWPEGRPFAVGPEGAAIDFSTEVRTRLDGLIAARGVAAWTPVQKRFRGAEIDRLFGADAQQMWRATGGGRLLFHNRGRTFTSLRLAGETYLVEERVFAFDEGARWENGRLPGQATDLHLVRFSGAGQVLVTTNRPLQMERVDGGCLSLPTTGLVGWSGALAPRLVGAEEGPAVPWIELSGTGVVLLVG